MAGEKKKVFSARDAALCAVLAALGTVLLYLSGTLPTARLALVAAAGLLPAAAVLTAGLPAGFAVYAVTAALSLLLVPSKGSALVYAAIFGHYPMIKSLAERLPAKPLEWAVKLAVFNALLTVLVLAAGTMLFDFLAVDWAVWTVYLAGNAAFVIYDLGFSGLITLFISKFGKYIKRRG